MSRGQPDCTARPITFTPCDAYLSCRLLKAGISPTHGWHQVAQKSSTTILFLRSCEPSFCPSSVGNDNPGRGADAWPAALRQSEAMSKSTRIVRPLSQYSSPAVVALAILHN